MKLEDWPEHVREFVPPGFDLDNYRDAERLDLDGWMSELFFRILGRRPEFGKVIKFRFGLLSSRFNTEGEKGFPICIPAGAVHSLSIGEIEDFYQRLPQDQNFLNQLEYHIAHQH